MPGSCSHVKVKVFSRAGYGRSAQLSRLLCVRGCLWLSLRFHCSGAEPSLLRPWADGGCSPAKGTWEGTCRRLHKSPGT